MRKHFQLHYDRGQIKEEAVRSGLIFIDTNVLLHFFRLGKEFCDTFFAALELVKDRLRIPYQVAKEYHTHYLELCVKQKIAYQNAIRHIENLTSPVTQLHDKDNDYTRYLSKDFKKTIDEQFNGILTEIEKRYNEEIESLDNEIKESSNFIKIADLLESKVLEPFSSQELDNIHSEAQQRYDAKIPPGYKDNGKDDNKYGDYIIWREMIRHMKTAKGKKHAVFVSDDIKEDWLTHICGEKHGTRQELIEEFYKETNCHFVCMTVDTFMDAVQTIHGTLNANELKIAKDASTGFRVYREGPKLKIKYYGWEKETPSKLKLGKDFIEDFDGENIPLLIEETEPDRELNQDNDPETESEQERTNHLPPDKD